MSSSKRAVALAVAAAAVAGVLVLPNAARAQSCTSIPISTTGITIEGGGHEVRVPAVSGVAVCLDTPGTPGIPWVQTEPGGGFSVLLRGSSGGDGSVTLTYSADGSPNAITVPIPGTDASGETCLVGVGFPARDDCAFKISPDDNPIPPVTPPPVTPSPVTPPPVTVPPTPPVEEICTQDVCVGPTIIESLPGIIRRLIATVMNIVDDIVVINCTPTLELLGLC